MEKNAILVLAEKRLKEIHEIRKTLMVEKLHYGQIPGVSKPILFKPGAELFLNLYGLIPHFQEEIEVVGLDRRITVTAELKNSEGRVVGNGYGFASTLEDKYKWRKASGKEEFEAAPPNERRTIRTGRESVHCVRQNPDNVLNTVIKMARKRAMVDAVLTHFALSGYISQDFDDESVEPPINQTIPSPIGTNRETSFSPDNSRFVNAIETLIRQYGPDRVREAEKAACVTLRSLANKNRPDQVQGYETVRTFLRKKFEEKEEENIFKTA